MEIKSDIPLKGKPWHDAIEAYSKIFTPRTQYDVFSLALSIGIMYDKKIDSFESDEYDSHSVPRVVVLNNDNGRLDTMFQAAILSSKTVDMSEEERLQNAFEPDVTINKMNFLLGFANFGVTKLVEQIGISELETMANLKNFLNSSAEGRNYEINEIPDEELMGDL